MNILIIGKAKTGTTVISKTIQKSTPGESQYHLEPKNIGFFENPSFGQTKDVNQIVKIIFEHWSEKPRMRNAIVHNEAVLKFDKLVCIFRDPRDELISRLLYIVYPYTSQNGLQPDKIEEWVALLERKERSPASISFISLFKGFETIFGVSFDLQLQYVLDQSESYYSFAKHVARPMCPIKYEDFMLGNLTELENYLGFPLVEDRSVDELGRTKRTGSFNNWKKVFTQEDVDYLKPVMSPVLEKFGYLDWAIEACTRLDPEHYSGYVKRLVA